MADIKLNDSHDIELKNFDFSVVRGNELTKQRIKQQLLFFYGEWYLNILGGVPYFEDILIKNPTLSIVEGAIKSAILSVNGVKSLTSFSLDYNTTNRTLLVSFSVSLSDGTEIAINNLDLLEG